MLTVIKEINSLDLKNELWSGALITLNDITENNKLEELMSLLTEMYPNQTEISSINELLEFDADWICKKLEIKKRTCHACGKKVEVDSE